MKGTNKKLIFLPGMVCDIRLWQPAIEHFEELYDVAYINLQKGNSLEDFFDSIHQEVEPHSALIGFSMGGFVASEYVLAFPERIDHLLMIGFDPHGFSKAKIAQRKRLIDKANTESIEIMPKEQLPFYLHKDSLSSESIPHLVQDMGKKAGQTTYIHQMQATLNRTNRTQQISQLDLKATCILADDDKIAPPKNILSLEEANIQTHLLSHCGHMIPIEKETELIETIESIL